MPGARPGAGTPCSRYREAMADAVASAGSAGMTYAEYLERERRSSTKHEFVRGELFAMSGARRAHNQIAGNVFALLWNAFQGRPCLVYGSDIRVKTGDEVGTYPDVSALCGIPSFSDATEDELLDPRLVVEVLSDSTEAYDRGEKFEHYESIPALREYLLASSSRQRLELFRRNDDGTWSRSVHGAGASVRLDSVGVELAVDAVYARAFAEPAG